MLHPHMLAIYFYLHPRLQRNIHHAKLVFDPPCCLGLTTPPRGQNLRPPSAEISLLTYAHLCLSHNENNTDRRAKGLFGFSAEPWQGITRNERSRNDLCPANNTFVVVDLC